MEIELTFFTIVRWVVGAILTLIWFGCTISNLIDLINARIHKTPTSLILFFGGLSGIIAVFIFPIPGSNKWAWLPAVLDLGCVPAGLVILFAVISGKFDD